MKRQWVRFLAIAGGAAAVSSLLVSCAGNPQKAKVEFLQKGDAYMKQKQYSSAAIEYRNALKVDPHYGDAYYRLGKADLALAQQDGSSKPDLARQEVQAAYKSFSQAVSSDPNQLEARVSIAEMILSAHAQKEYYAATDDLNYVLKQDPKNVEARRALGGLFLAQNQGDQALQEFSKATEISPNDAASYVGVALANEAMHKAGSNDTHLNDAELSFKKAIEVDPHAIQAYLGLAQLYVEQKQPSQAEDTVQAGIKANPSVVPLYELLARFYVQQKNPSQAEQLLQAGIKANPSVTGLYVDLAQFYIGEKNPAKAEQAIQGGIKTNPSEIPLYIGLARLYEGEGKQSDAEGVLTNLANQLPKSADAAIAIGDFYRGAKMDDRALTEYQRGLTANPENINIEESIEEVYLDKQRTDEAANLSAQLLKQAPADAIAGVDHGRVLMAQGKVPEAVEVLQKVAAANANSPAAHYFLAMAYGMSNNSTQENSELQQTLAQANVEQQGGRPSVYLPHALVALVKLNTAEGKFSVAQLYAQEFVKDNPASPEGHLMLGEAYLNLKQMKQANDEFQEAQNLAPNSPGVHLDMASVYNSQRDFAAAEKEFQAAMHEAPRNATVVAAYGTFLISQKQLPKATALVQQFLAQNPDQADAHYLMGEVDLLQKNYSAALTETQKSLQINPKSANSYVQLGQIYRDQGDRANAIQAYEKGMAVSAPSAAITTVIGSVYMEEGDFSNASSEFQKALNLDPNFAVAANNLAWIYAEQGQNLDTALSLAQRAQAQNPGTPSFSDTLAWVMFRKGDYAGALPLLKECVQKQPDSAQFLYHLGMVLVADGQKTEGKAKIQAALTMNLDTQDAEQARKTLSQ